jgi:hypothetical protein
LRLPHWKLPTDVTASAASDEHAVHTIGAGLGSDEGTFRKVVLGGGRVVAEPDEVVVDPEPAPDDPEGDDDVVEDDRERPSDNEPDPQAARPADMITAAATAPGTAPNLNRGRLTVDLVTRSTLCPGCAQTSAPGRR